jgi:hypothetical protein
VNRFSGIPAVENEKHEKQPHEPEGRGEYAGSVCGDILVEAGQRMTMRYASAGR